MRDSQTLKKALNQINSVWSGLRLRMCARLTLILQLKVSRCCFFVFFWMGKWGGLWVMADNHQPDSWNASQSRNVAVITRCSWFTPLTPLEHDWFDCGDSWRGSLSDPWELRGVEGYKIQRFTCREQPRWLFPVHVSAWPCTWCFISLPHLELKCMYLSELHSSVVPFFLLLHNNNLAPPPIQTLLDLVNIPASLPHQPPPWEPFVKQQIMQTLATGANNGNLVWTVRLTAPLTIDDCGFYCLPVSLRVATFLC